MPHFTYKSPEMIEKDALCQGDILEITDDIKTVLEEVHPYFIQERYKYFIVITQSCDLVKRNGNKCKSPYITLAAVRSYEEFIYREMKKDGAYEEIGELKLLEDKKYNKYYQLLERIFNNTEPEYFFLYKDSELKFNESMIAYLKVTIALKSDLHYDKCLGAKRIELADEFKAKLGWLVGNIYSRVGTTDWTNVKSETDRKQMLQNELYNRFVISDKPHLKGLKKVISESGKSFKDNYEAMDYLSTISFQTNYDKVLELLEKEISGTQDIDEDKRERLITRLKNNTMLKTLVK
jgi:hypothetical protein